MTIEVSASELSKAVSIASKAANSKFNNGYPSAFRLTASSSDSRLTLAAFDLSTAIECSINALIGSELDVIVSAQMLKDILSAAQGDRVELNNIAKKQRLGISSMRCNWDIGYLMPDDYPVAPELSEGSTVLDVSSTDLIDLLGGIVYAASADETRPNIMAVNIQIDSAKDKMTIRSAATDGHRLATAKYYINTFNGNSLIGNAINIPSKVIKDLIGILKSEDVYEDSVLITYDDSMVKFTWKDLEMRARIIISRLTDGEYPPYEQLFASSFAGSVVIDRHSLLSAVNRASIVARASNNKVIVKFGDTCSVEADQELGGSIEDIEDIELSGEPIDFCFNYKYLSEALKNISTTKVRFEYNAHDMPVTIKGDREESSIVATHMISPIGKASG
jgi:DNA polymerase-3 subunit beta